MSYTIRAATRADLPALLEMIRELACFEKLEHAMEATVESLDESFFGPQVAAGALLAYCGEDLAGYAIYFYTFSSFVGRRGLWLEDVYVRPAFRRQGLGVALIRATAAVGAERNCGRFEWTALNWNQNAIDLYRRLGAESLDGWTVFRLGAEGLRRLAAGPAEGGAPPPG